jgi:hypothetical protein
VSKQAVTLDMSTAQPIQAAPVKLDMSTAQPIQAAPGFWNRLGQSTGVPTSKAEATAVASPGSVDGVPVALPMSGLKAIVDYGKNLYEKGKNFVENPGAGTGIDAVTALTPTGGLQKTFAQDVAGKNYKGAAGTAVGVAAQAAIPEAAERAAPAMSSVGDTVEAIADHPITRAMAKTVDLGTFERLGKIYDAWKNQMPAEMKARAQAMRPVYPGAPLPEHPGVFPGASLPEAPAPELVQANALYAGAKPAISPSDALGVVPARSSPPGAAGSMAESIAAPEAAPKPMSQAADGSNIPRTLSGESALRQVLGGQDNANLLKIARSRGINVSQEAQLKPGVADSKLIEKIVSDFSDDELKNVGDTYLENTRMGPQDFKSKIGAEANRTLSMQTYFPDVKVPTATLKRTAAAVTTAKTIPMGANTPDLLNILKQSLEYAQQRKAAQ